jgi:AcrR family transcriptional regulator
VPVLTDLLAGASPKRPTALDAFALARRTFISGRRVDMTKLAAEVGVSRVTLNRWVGSRDLLLAEILWSLAEPTLIRARHQANSTGGQLVADTITRFAAQALEAPYFRAFLQREPEIALRILTTARTPFQARVAHWMRDLIAAHVAPGRLPLSAEDLGYLLVRIGESFCYVDHITGGEPDPEKIRQATAALLGVPTDTT